MIRFRKYNDINFFSYFSITNYIALICTLVCLFIPMYTNNIKKESYDLIEIMGFQISVINILAIIMLFSACMIFFINMFFQPSWTTYFINYVFIVYLFVCPVMLNFKLFPELNLHHNSLSFYIGSILVMISSAIYTILEIYKLSVMNVFVNKNIKDKKQKLLQNYENSRKYKLETSKKAIQNIQKNDKKKKKEEKKKLKSLSKEEKEKLNKKRTSNNQEEETMSPETLRAKFLIKKSRKQKKYLLKTQTSYNGIYLATVEEYSKFLDTIYKI